MVLVVDYKKERRFIPSFLTGKDNIYLEQPIGYASKSYILPPKTPTCPERHTQPPLYHKGHEENLRALSYLYPVKDSVM